MHQLLEHRELTWGSREVLPWLDSGGEADSRQRKGGGESMQGQQVSGQGQSSFPRGWGLETSSRSG